MAQLRAHFGDRLLVPSGRRMVLTERGRALVESVGLAVAHVERVFTPTPGFDPATSTRTFRIVATDNIELFLLPRPMAWLGQHAPRVDLRMHHLPPDWIRVLTRGDIDLKLGHQYGIPASFRGELLFEERFTCVVRRDHPLRSARPTLKQFAAVSHLDAVLAVPQARRPAASSTRSSRSKASSVAWRSPCPTSWWRRISSRRRTARWSCRSA